MVFKKRKAQPLENLFVYFILPLATEFVKNSFREISEEVQKSLITQIMRNDYTDFLFFRQISYLRKPK
jgi:hypothetical protein